MTGRRHLIAYATHPDGRLRLSDLRDMVAKADAPVELPDGGVIPPMRGDAVVDVISAYRSRNCITLDEEGA